LLNLLVVVAVRLICGGLVDGLAVAVVVVVAVAVDGSLVNFLLAFKLDLIGLFETAAPPEVPLPLLLMRDGSASSGCCLDVLDGLLEEEEEERAVEDCSIKKYLTQKHTLRTAHTQTLVFI
jgi:hypothetical protein